MKKVVLIALAVGLLALPVMAQVESGAGKISIHGAVDFLGVWIQADKINHPKTYEFSQPEVENLMIRDTILSLNGELSDKVSWELTGSFTGGTIRQEQGGPSVVVGSTTYYTASVITGTGVTSAPQLLTAKVDLKLIPMTTLTFGRFLPDQSPSLQYHILSKVHTIYFPMVDMQYPYGGPESTGVLLVPGFQTGAQAKIGNDKVHVSLGWFNGIQPQLVEDAHIPGKITLSAPGIGNFSETDASKAGLIKVAVNLKGIVAGVHYWDEYANNLQTSFGTDDARLDIIGAYVGYNQEKFHVLAEYLENRLQWLGSNWPVDNMKDIRQNDWYVQAGVSPIKALEVVARYEAIDDFDLANDSFKYDEENWITLGVNYFLLEKNAAIALQYIWKDHDQLTFNNNELDLLVEVDI